MDKPDVRALAEDVPARYHTTEDLEVLREAVEQIRGNGYRNFAAKAKLALTAVEMSLEAADRATRETAKAEGRREGLEEAAALRRATFELLFTDECFIGTHWEAYPDADKGAWPALCAHVWSYGADAEEIPDTEVIPLWKLVGEYGKEAIQAWVCHKRGLDKPVKGNLSERGRAAIRALAKAEGKDG